VSSGRLRLFTSLVTLSTRSKWIQLSNFWREVLPPTSALEKWYCAIVRSACSWFAHIDPRASFYLDRCIYHWLCMVKSLRSRSSHNSTYVSIPLQFYPGNTHGRTRRWLIISDNATARESSVGPVTREEIDVQGNNTSVRLRPCCTLRVPSFTVAGDISQAEKSSEA
jgi:hypothetical protein